MVAPSAGASQSHLPLLLGIGGGGLVLVVIIAMIATGGSESPEPRAAGGSKKSAAPESLPRAAAPDVSGLEAQGQAKCKAGLEKVLPRLNPDPSSPKERVRADLEEGLRLLKAGLEAYQKAALLAGKRYDLGQYERAQKVAITLFCTDLEKEAQASCDAGLKIIQSTQTQVQDTRKLSDPEKAKLVEDLRKGVRLITEGMGLFDRSFEVSGRRFETAPYQEALKVARPIILELK
jgi:hypothetical protein